jgi:hypothetical protein
VALISGGARGRPYNDLRKSSEVFAALQEYKLPSIAQPSRWYLWISEELKNLAFECFASADKRPSMKGIKDRLQSFADGYVSPQNARK